MALICENGLGVGALGLEKLPRLELRSPPPSAASWHCNVWKIKGSKSIAHFHFETLQQIDYTELWAFIA
jgi:hypothetical protein